MATYSGTLPVLTNLNPDIIGTTAIALAWPYGTKKSIYSYPDGHATDAFNKAFDKVYPTHEKWGQQTGKGASCDIFAGTCIRASGYDKKMPRQLADQVKYFPKHPDIWTDVPYKTNADLKHGDVIIYLNKVSGGHICIYVEQNGKGYIKEAGYNSKRFGMTVNPHSYKPSDYKSFHVYRAKGSIRSYLKAGDYSVQVKRLQKFLNWLLDSKLTTDGIFGPKTKSAVVMFQTKSGLQPDGVFGKKSLAAAKIANKTEKTKIKCVDVSAHQGIISEANWKKAKKTCQATIIRSSWTHQASFKLEEDKYFAKNIANAHKAGMKIGAYHYSQAISVKEAEKEASFMIKTLKKYKSYITLPVAFDWEFGGRLNSRVAKKLGKVQCMKICNAFCAKMHEAGYETMVYANLATLNNYISNDLYKHNKIWVAQYNNTCDYKKPYYMWQYTSRGSVTGIGTCDLNYIYDPTLV